ncbi:MAG: endonuclease III [Spirochaetes bacterium]|nr:MAG: endonuclease III [Spirochaetota bacterium]
MENYDIHRVVSILREEVKTLKEPIVTKIAKKRDPFRVLISTVISLRTKDKTTEEASERLFEAAHTPEDMLTLPIRTIENLIYPAGFYKVKAMNIHNISKMIVEKYDGNVPDTIGELLKLPGVGRKTANLVVTLGYNKQGICVDTHVHRISNRLGYVNTKTPEQTEMALREKLPKEYWIEINDLLVTYGQNICTPVSPYCSRCRLRDICERRGVTRSR